MKKGRFTTFWLGLFRKVHDPAYYPALVLPAPLDDRVWNVHFTDEPALLTLNQLLVQDQIRHEHELTTYLSPRLLEAADRLIPARPGIYRRDLEQWVLITHIIVTYQIRQEAAPVRPLLDGKCPSRIQQHLYELRHALRHELTPSL